jgi:hypothetical protein
MSLAQQLYQGIDLGAGEGQVGLITYMRTDSNNLSNEVISDISDFVTQKFSKSYLQVKKKSKSVQGAQEAHEAIRPTYISRTPESLRNHLDQDQFKLYQLIWNNTVASQMASAIYDRTTFEITANAPDSDTQYVFSFSGDVLKFDGFRKIITDQDSDDEIPDLKEYQELKDHKKSLEEIKVKEVCYQWSCIFTEITKYEKGIEFNNIQIAEIEDNILQKESDLSNKKNELNNKNEILSLEMDKQIEEAKNKNQEEYQKMYDLNRDKTEIEKNLKSNEKLWQESIEEIKDKENKIIENDKKKPEIEQEYNDVISKRDRLQEIITTTKNLISGSTTGESNIRNLKNQANVDIDKTNNEINKVKREVERIDKEVKEKIIEKNKKEEMY